MADITQFILFVFCFCKSEWANNKIFVSLRNCIKFSVQFFCVHVCLFGWCSRMLEDKIVYGKEGGSHSLIDHRQHCGFCVWWSFNQVIRFVVLFCVTIFLFVCSHNLKNWIKSYCQRCRCCYCCMCVCEFFFIKHCLGRPWFFFLFFIASNGRIKILWVSVCVCVCAPHVWRPSFQIHAYVQYSLTYVHINCELLVYGLRYTISNAWVSYQILVETKANDKEWERKRPKRFARRVN